MNEATQTLLHEIMQNTEMGRTAAEKLLEKAEEPNLRRHLEQELAGFEDVSRCAAAMLAADGQEPAPKNPLSRIGARMGITMNLLRDHSPRKMAEMLIEGNQIGITQLTEALHDAQDAGPGAKALAQRLQHAERDYSAELNSFL